MKYMLIIYGNQELWNSVSPDEQQRLFEAFDAFNKKYYDSGELLGAYGVADAAATKLVRLADGQPAVTDGPYLETKEYLASWYLLDVDSEERALAIAAELPSAKFHPPVEVWPVLHPASRETGVARRRWVTAAKERAAAMATSTEDLLRALAPQVLGVLMRRYGGLDTCEDAVQEALLDAATQWPASGTPDNPRGWLLTVATRRLTDMLRGESARRRREDAVYLATPPAALADAGADARIAGPDGSGAPGAGPDHDDTLTLLFLCCHPGAVSPPRRWRSRCGPSAG